MISASGGSDTTVRSRRRHDDRHLQLHIRSSTMAYGPEITDRQLAYGSKVTLDTGYGPKV